MRLYSAHLNWIRNWAGDMVFGDLEMNTDLDVSVLICTRNRAAQLASVLQSACKLKVPDEVTWELLLVDNGSSDNTADIARSFSDRLPIRVVRQEIPGLSNARNMGVSKARGKYICWTDDDVLIDQNWLSAYVEAFRRHPDAAVFGGKVIPRFEGDSPPEWLEKGKHSFPLANLLAYRDLGELERELSFAGGLVPYGANFAVRTLEQRSALYDPALGVSPLHKRLGEESDAIFRMFSSGATGWWVPDAVVNHIIPFARQTPAYVYEYYFLSGATMSHMRENAETDNYLTAGGQLPQAYAMTRFRSLRRGIRQLMEFGVARLNRDEVWLDRLAQAGYHLGAGTYGSRFAGNILNIRRWL
jgi:glycosyltransferase involved in cell wall biosynthesis